MKALDVLAAILVIIGALNWGLVGAAQFDLVTFLFGTSIITRLVFIVVGLAGLYQAIQVKGIQHRWGPAVSL